MALSTGTVFIGGLVNITGEAATDENYKQVKVSMGGLYTGDLKWVRLKK